MSEALWRPRPRPSPGPDAVTVGAWTPATPADLTIQRLRLADILRDGAGPPRTGTDALERLQLAFEELVSNALRYGRAPVHATVTAFDSCWLLEVSDAAPELPPTPATGRNPAEGGLGLRLVARISGAHGWHTDGRRKTAWVLVEHIPDGRAPSGPGTRGGPERLVDAIGDVSDALGFTPATRLIGPVGDLPEDMTVDLLAVIREALTNVARHARARSAAVDVEVTGETVTARVTDDGIGMAGAPRDGGLADLRRRAVWHGGTLTVGPGSSGGTRLVWAVPYGPTATQPRRP
jgi:two-component sensor histidine kinase